MKTSISKIKDALRLLGNNYILVAVADLENETFQRIELESEHHGTLLFMALCRDARIRGIIRNAIDLVELAETKDGNDKK